MKQIHSQLIVGAAIVGAVTIIAVPALATSSVAFFRTELSTGLLGPVDAKADKTGTWDLFLKTKDDTTLGLDNLRVESGGHSGWHTHAGITVVTVKVGPVRWYDGADPVCAFKTYQTGDSFVEPANNVHLVRNMTGGDVVFTAVQMRPSGTGGRIDADKPTNCPTI